MITIAEIKDSFARYKSDITDVEAEEGLFLEWAQFVARYIYKNVKGVDPSRFVKSQLYSVLLPPQAFALPSDLQDLNQTNCGLYKYDTRRRKVVTFDTTETGLTFSDSGGTSAYNTNQFVEGDASRGFTSDAAANLLLSFDDQVDWTDFEDGKAASPTNDYISIYVYLGNTLPTSLTIEFSTNTNGSSVGVNQFSYTKSSGLVAGWNAIKVLKSAFTQTGSPAWSALGYLRLIYTGGDTTTDVYWDNLELVEGEVNGKSQTDKKLGISGYGAKFEGYYLDGSDVVFTNGQKLINQDYMMRYMPEPPVFDAESDYFTLDGTATGAKLVDDENMEYLVKAIDVLYTQWDRDPTAESLADFRFVRALDGLLSGINRTPQVSTMYNPSSDF